MKSTKKSPVRGLANDLSVLLDGAAALYEKTSEERFLARHDRSPEFNILKITKRGDYEVTTHQPVLANLLNPEGSHAHGGLVLQHWLDFLSRALPKKTLRSLVLPKDMSWKVEQGIDWIDVRLRHREVHVVVEMKWNHTETGNQLQGYWQKERVRAPGKPVIAVYLTKRGDRPSGQDPLFKDWLVCMSFDDLRDEILSKALTDIRSTRLREAVEQYIELIAESEADE